MDRIDLLLSYIERTPWRKKYEIAESLGTTPEEISRWIHQRNRISNAYIKVLNIRLSEPIPEKPFNKNDLFPIFKTIEHKVVKTDKEFIKQKIKTPLTKKQLEILELEKRMDERSEKIKLMKETGWL